MIDIEELKRKALACQAFHAAGCPVDDPRDTYPPDHYDAAVQPKYILELIERLEATESMVDKLLAHCPNGECMECGEIVCPHDEPLHFHHDGCPACYQDES